MERTVRIEHDDDGRRLDRVLRKYLADLPLSALHRLLRKGAVLVDGRKASASDRVRAGSLLRLPAALDLPPREERQELRGGEAPETPRAGFVILYEDDDFLVAYKESGLLTHGEDSLEELVSAYLSPTLAPSLSFRPGPLHRLDRVTSGIVVFSKSLEGARNFSAALGERRIGKRYLAVLEGTLTGTADWQDRLQRDRETKVSQVAEDGAAAVTRVEPLAWDGMGTLALVSIGTGRTHQIRVQAAAHGHPLLGDRKYGGGPLPGGPLLHAWELDPSPRSGERLPPRIVAVPPRRFLDYVRQRFGEAVAEGLKRGFSPKNGDDAVR